MSPMEICVLILTSVVVVIGLVFILIAVFLIRFMRSLNDSIKDTIKDVMIKDTMTRVHTVLDNVDQTQQIINSNLPAITGDASKIVANVSGITAKVDHGVGVGMNVLEKTPLTVVYTLFGLGRKVAKVLAERKKNKKV